MKVLEIGDRCQHPWHGTGSVWALTAKGVYVRFEKDNTKPGHAVSTRLVWPSELQSLAEPHGDDQDATDGTWQGITPNIRS